MEKKGVKILVLIIILALIGGAIYLIVDKKPKSKNGGFKDAATANSYKYFSYLSEGYDSVYNGVDRLYSVDSFTKDDLSNGMILTAAFNYVLDPANEIDTGITAEEYAALEEYYDLSDAVTIKGKYIREAIKVLFGITYKDQDYSNNDFKYSYTYSAGTDMYIKKTKTNSADDNYSVLNRLISSDKKNNTTVARIAIAYIVKTDKKYAVYSDANHTNLVKEFEGSFSLNDLSDKEVEKLPKYDITTKEVNENYTFEKIEAVK